MRKSLILTLLLLIISVAFIASASGRINAASDAVTLGETVLHGDRTAADGLELELRIHSNYRLFWDTSYIFAAEPEISTDFSFSQSQKRQTMEYVNRGVLFEFTSSVSVSSNGAIDLDSYDTQTSIYGLTAVIKDVASRATPGGEHVETVLLRDYYEFYPFNINLDIPVYWMEETAEYINEYMAGGLGGGADLLKMSEIFKIPVSDDCKLEVHVSKNSSGEVYGYDMSVLEEYPNLWSKSVETDDGCYFVLNCRNADGTVYDTSHISLGYGIYYLPYYKEDGRDYIAPDSLQMVYELTSGIEIIEFLANEDRTQLLLITGENQKCFLTVIDIETMTQVQRIELFDYPDNSYLAVYPHGDFWVLMSSNLQKLAVVSLQAGEYRLDFVTEFSDEQNANAALLGIPVMAYDGERLAIAGIVDVNSSRYATPNFYVSVYDKNGLAYLGSYRSSLAVGWDVDYSTVCRGIDNEPMSIRWARDGYLGENWLTSIGRKRE